MKRIRHRLLALLLGVVAALVLLELLLRLTSVVFMAWVSWDNDRRARDDAHVVLCLGESTTAYGGEDSWPSQLQAILDREGGPVNWRVVNAGVSGANTSELLRRLDGFLGRYQPHTVVAMMGANDHEHGATPPPPATRLGKVLNHLRLYRLVAQLRHDSGRPEPPPPCDGSRDGPLGTFFCTAISTSLANRDLGEATSMLRLALRFDWSVPTLVEMAEMAERFELRAEQEGFLRIAVAKEPGFAQTGLLLGRSLRQQHRCQEALEVMEAYVKPGQGVGGIAEFVLTDMATCLVELGRTAQARTLLEAALREGPGRRFSGRFFIRLVGVYEELGMVDEARALINHARWLYGSREAIARILLFHQARGDDAMAGQVQLHLDRLLADSFTDSVKLAWRELHDAASRRGARLIAVQYPTLDAAPLQALVSSWGGVEVVDNEALFKEALGQLPFDRLFWDACYGSFGHATLLGNQLLATNVATTVLGRKLPFPSLKD